MGDEEATQLAFQHNNNKTIPHSTPLTLNWLSENYESAEGVCIPRNVIYKHYCDFCQKNGMIPVNPASFGKVSKLYGYCGVTPHYLNSKVPRQNHDTVVVLPYLQDDHM
jgi:hypothetical protein